MIDEKKLIERIKGMSDTCNLFRWRSPKKIKQGITSIIAHEPKIGEWIPCSERLPENISTVIVQVKEIEKPTFGWYEDMDNRWVLSEKDFVGLKKFTVIAWQPLPEAYKK